MGGRFLVNGTISAVIDLLSKRPKPYEVFTPGSPPLDEHNVYVKRQKAEESLRRFIQRRQIPIVWGEYGVGKTSLVQRYFEKQEKDGSLVYIASVSGLDLSDIFRTILEHLRYEVEVESTTTGRTGVDGGIDLKIVKANAQSDVADSLTRKLVVTSPTDTGMNKLIKESKLTVVLDEVHRASDVLRQELVDWIKATRAGVGGFTLVLVGTSTDAGRLVSLDFGIDRFVKEMRVELLSDDEARWIVDEGFRRLGLSISEELRNRLVSSAAGAPTIVHELCLDAAESAIEANRKTVIQDDLQSAVKTYLDEHGGRLADHYYRAVETTGPKRYRKQVLQAVAKSSTDYATMEDIRIAVSENLNTDVPASSLSGPLRDLKTAEYGSILKDVDREISGNRIHNLTTFTDPMMKSFVRFMNNLDETKLLPSPPPRLYDGEES